VIRWLFIFILMPILSHAATWYVYPDQSGSDSSGQSWSTALRTLTQVNDSVGSADTCFFYGRIRGTGQTHLILQSGSIDGSDTNRTYYVCGNGSDDTWLKDHSASIWGSDSITNWASYNLDGDTNIWQAYTGGNGVTYTLAQIDGNHDTLLTGDATGLPTDEGWFHWQNDTIYAWFIDGVDPSAAAGDTVDVEAAWNDDETILYYGTDYSCLYGLDLRYGSPVVYFTDIRSDFNQIFYCYIRGAGGCDGCNTACIHSKYGGSHPAADANWATASVSGYGNYFKACTLSLARKEEGSYGPDNESALDFYSQWGYIIESCYVTPSQYNGLKVKSESRDGVMRFNTVNFTGLSSNGANIYYYCSYNRDSLYGNILIGNGSAGTGILLRGCEVGAWDSRGEYDANDEPMFIQNNTIYNVGDKGIFTGYGDDDHDWDGIARMKYNIIHTIPSLDKIVQFGPVDGCTVNPGGTGCDTGFFDCDSNAYYVSQALTTAFAVDGNSVSWTTWNGFEDIYSTMWSTSGDAGFTDAANGDFSRPSAGVEIPPYTKAGVYFDRYGAVQTSTQPPDTVRMTGTIRTTGTVRIK
jgi:hypothetical protein